MTDWKAVGARIRERRGAMGLTQEELGRLVGSSGNYVAQVENGLPLSEKKLAVYSGALDMSLPLLRYNAAQQEDVEKIAEIAAAEGRRSALTEMRAWADERAADAVFANARKLTPEEIARAVDLVKRGERSAKKPSRRTKKA